MGAGRRLLHALGDPPGCQRSITDTAGLQLRLLVKAATPALFLHVRGEETRPPMLASDAYARSRLSLASSEPNRVLELRVLRRTIVYPSAVLKDPDFGVSCRKIDGAQGQGRNLEEARAVVEEAAGLVRARADRSIGIVAMNQAQRDLIETLMVERAAVDPDIQAYRDRWGGNLESSRTAGSCRSPELGRTRSRFG